MQAKIAASKRSLLCRPMGISRLEMTLLFILFVAGFGIRAWHLSSVGLDHFDEGVYTLSALGLTDAEQPHRLYPDQIKFSPPVYITLIALSYHLFGAPLDIVAISINVFLGALSILAIWWVGRSWFDVATGIGAATFLTFSEYHIALSRTALTDITFALFFLLALGLITIAIQRQSLTWSVLAGLAVGLAWNTKYHGWFALLITGMALLPYLWFNRTRKRIHFRSFFLYSTMGAIAVACYLPWALYINSRPGGYLALVAYQRTLIDSHWLTNLKRQTQLQGFLDGQLGSVSVLVVIWAVILVTQPRQRSTWRFLLMLLVMIIAALGLGGVGTAALLTVATVPVVLRRPMHLSTWLLLSWLALWFLVTPLYRPFARLVLPFTLATYLGAGFLLSVVVTELQRRHEGKTSQLFLPVFGVINIAAVLFILYQPNTLWLPSRSLATAAKAMETIIPPGSRVIVVGEPALAFYLQLAGRSAFERTEDPAIWESLSTPVYMTTGIYAQSVPMLREGLERLDHRLILLGTYPMNPKDIRLLDDFSPISARQFRIHPDETYEITLYRLLSASEAKNSGVDK